MLLASQWWHCHSPCTVGTNHTFNLNQNGGGNVYGEPSVIALSGTAARVETSDYGNAAKTNGASLATGYVTQQRNCEAVLALLAANSASSVVAPSGYTLATSGVSSGVSQVVAIAYKINSTATAESPTWTSLATVATASALVVDSANTPVAAVWGGAECNVYGGCAEAWSMTRQLVSGYNGPLFQIYDGGATHDIGQTGNIVNMTALNGFCPNPATCYISRVYAQVNSANDWLPSTVNHIGVNCTGGGAYKCAPALSIDPTTNLPRIIISGSGIAQFNIGGSDNNLTGVSTGTNPITLMTTGKPAPSALGPIWCCGVNGIIDEAHYNSGFYSLDVVIGYGRTGGATVNCVVSTNYCIGIDSGDPNAQAGWRVDYAGYLIANSSIVSMQYDSTNGTTWALNGTTIHNWSIANSGAANIGLQYVVSGGTDASQPAAIILWDSYIVGHAASSTERTNAANNSKAFYRMAVFP